MALRTARNVSLTLELERYISMRVASGQYQSASEVVRAALRLLQEREPTSPSLASGPDGAPPMRGAPGLE